MKMSMIDDNNLIREEHPLDMFSLKTIHCNEES
jgi:hypothetical protein